MSTLYLPDADAVIKTFEDYYPLGRIPQFGPWLVKQGNLGKIKIPSEIFAEITPEEEEFKSWIEDPSVQQALILQERQMEGLVNMVLTEGYHIDQPEEADKEAIGNDHNLIAYALVDKANRVVVTKEVSQPSKEGRNRKIPDVCDALRVECIDDFELYKRLDFNTRPKA